MASGLGDVQQGRRIRGARRIFRAAADASSALTRLRWFVYGCGAAVLPRRAHWWLVTRPMPERGA